MIQQGKNQATLCVQRQISVVISVKSAVKTKIGPRTVTPRDQTRRFAAQMSQCLNYSKARNGVKSK